MTTISAKTILRSRNASRPDKVLSTLLLRYPRFIHAELMTHRAFSRNAASSRAIPVQKIIDDILADTAMPIHWGKNQKGMQATEECNAEITFKGDDRDWPVSREDRWLYARNAAIKAAEEFSAAGYHKQVVNRLLEPFMHITVLVSATEWLNFLELRDHADAEPHIAILAREVRQCLEDESTIQTLQPGEWHMPWMTREKSVDIWSTHRDDAHLNAMIKYSTACCASTSYKTVEGFEMTIERAIAIHDKLVGSTPIHASPAEHIAQVDEWVERNADSFVGGWHNSHQHGNFEGFRQYRFQLPA